MRFLCARASLRSSEETSERGRFLEGPGSEMEEGLTKDEDEDMIERGVDVEGKGMSLTRRVFEWDLTAGAGQLYVEVVRKPLG